MNILKTYISIACLMGVTAEVSAQGQQRVIVGSITEMVDNTPAPLIGANISIVNSLDRSIVGTITNTDGQYNLAVPAGEKNLTIVISYIGMKTKRIKYTGQKTLDVRLESLSKDIDEVVVTAARTDRNDMGVGTTEQVSATQKLYLDKLTETSPATSVEEVLQGQMGGVDIAVGGDPGAKSAIRIRGTGTLNADADPLIVIDGVPYTDDTGDFDFSNANEEDLGTLLNISPNDIESVEVLKDASATAIWGTKGANGVLVIKTKGGRVGKTRFSFSSKWTMKEEPTTIPMLNGDEYVSLMQDAIWNSVNYVGVNSPTARSYMRLLFDTPEIGDDPSFPYYNEYKQNTDWLSLVRQNALTSDNSFSMTGGGEKATYRMSLGYMKDMGTTIGSSMDRLNASMRIDYNFSRKLRFGANFSYSQSNVEANWASTVRAEAFRKMPNKSPWVIDPQTGEFLDQYFTRQTSDWEGKFNGSSQKSASNYNPVAMVNESENKTMQRETNIQINAHYDILPGFSYNGYIALKAKKSKVTTFLPQNVTGVVWISPYANLSSDGMSESLSINTFNQLNYIKDWSGKHKLIANLIWRTGQSTSSSYSSSTYGMASSEMQDPTVGTSVAGMGSGEYEGRSISGVAQANYTLLGRYVFQGTINMESNSSMGKSKRVAYFPSVGLNWNIQNEPFMKAAKDAWLDMAKIRFSYGQSGRAPSGNAVYMGAYQASGDNYMNMTSIKPVRMQLDNLKWETSTEYDIGADFILFQGRVRFTFDYYTKTSKDILRRNFGIPSTTGFSTINWFNSGSAKNEGWEFRTDVVIWENKDWRISGNLNLSRNRNKITELPMNSEGGQTNADDVRNGVYAYLEEVNRPIGSFFGYKYKGVYKDKDATYARDADGNIMNDVNGNPIVMKNGTYTCYPGDAMYEDVNHDGVINKYDIVYLGNSMPIVTGGAGVNIRYKQFTLNAFFHGRLGQSVINRARLNNEAMYSSDNQSKAVLRRWRSEGDDTDIPRALWQQGLNYLGSDRFVEKASFVRLKTLSLSYAFPKSICRKLSLNSLSLFATGYNLFTWTNYTGQDPEVSYGGNFAEDSATTPVARRYAFGVNLSF